jgi:hypothetical protein
MQLVIFASMFLFTSFGTHIYLCCAIKYSLKVGFFQLSFSPKISIELIDIEISYVAQTYRQNVYVQKFQKKSENKNLLEPLQTIFFQNLGKGIQCILSFMIPHHAMVLRNGSQFRLEYIKSTMYLQELKLKVYWTNH